MARRGQDDVERVYAISRYVYPRIGIRSAPGILFCKSRGFRPRYTRTKNMLIFRRALPRRTEDGGRRKVPHGGSDSLGTRLRSLARSDVRDRPAMHPIFNGDQFREQFQSNFRPRAPWCPPFPVRIIKLLGEFLQPRRDAPMWTKRFRL